MAIRNDLDSEGAGSIQEDPEEDNLVEVQIKLMEGFTPEYRVDERSQKA